MHWNVGLDKETHILEGILAGVLSVLMMVLLVGAFLISSHP